MNEKLKKRIIYETEKGSVIILFNILKKYNLEESFEEIFKKIKRKEKPKISIILKKIKDLIFKDILKEEFILFLEKELNINKQIAEKIFKDIEINLISVSKIITTKNSLKKENLKNKTIFLKPSIVLGLEKNK